MAYIEAVIPVYNEEANVDELVRRVGAALGSISEDWSIRMVDDGSADATWAQIRGHHARDPRVKGVRFARNFGQHTAITAGLHHADGDWVVVMDGDLQDRPEIIPDLYAKAQEGFDIVWVARSERPVGCLYMFAQRIFHGLLRNLSGTHYNPKVANFSIIRRRVNECYRELGEEARFYAGQIHWLGFRTAEIEAPHDERFGGAPAYTLKARIQLAQTVLISYSVLPLYLAVYFGLFTMIGSVIYGTYIIVRALLGEVSVEGWASVIVSLYFLSGVLMALIGMNSIYLARVVSQIRRRPIYVVAETVDA